VAVCILAIGYIVARALYPPYINITRSEYEQALDKWKAHYIQEYEITLENDYLLDDKMVLHVSESDNKVEQLAPRMRPFDTLTELDVERLRYDTIEGLFAQADEALRRESMSEEHPFYATYRMSFDPALGYPNHFEVTYFNANDMNARITVTNLKVIK